jgi:type II secretory ATPase GspE/PulE/Tfp pilus assembly ATPase PilB-like protein
MIDTFAGHFDGKRETPDRRFVDGILLTAISRGASEITIEPLEREVRVRYTIAGERVPACASLPAGAAASLATIVKEYARLDVDDREHSQAGHVRLRAETCPGRVHDIRMQIGVSPTEFGEVATIRIREATLRETRGGAPSSAIQTREDAGRAFDRTIELVKALAGGRFAVAHRRSLVPRPPGAVRGPWAG